MRGLVYYDRAYYFGIMTIVSFTLATRSKAWIDFARSDAGIMGSNPTQGMEVSLCVALCR
jgi:hypothetical protein